MCWECDHPGSTRADYLEYLSGLIEEYGWAVQGVERDRIHPPWACPATPWPTAPPPPPPPPPRPPAPTSSRLGTE